MLCSYKYRIYPNKQQEKHLIQAMGCVRYIYNKALEIKNKHYEETGKSLSYVDLANGFLLVEKAKHEWLRQPNSQSLQASLGNLDTAFSRFFKKVSKFPRFKSKHDNRQSLQYPQAVSIDWKANRVQIPKCGKVFIVLDRKFEGQIKTCTVSKTPTNKFFISILVEDHQTLPAKPALTIQLKTLGIDLGIKHFAITSNNQKFDNPKHLQASLKKLTKLQRRLSRKQKGSKNRNKARLKVAQAHENVANQRKDFLHQITSQLMKSDNQAFILEDLNVAGMLKNHRLALSIQDCGWGMFKQFLTYKAEWNGKHIIEIGRFDPSSKMCSCCGSINQALALKDREWTCSKCNTTHDRDLNAAINIKKFGQIKIDKMSGQELPKEPVSTVRKRSYARKKAKIEMPEETGSMKQETRSSEQ